MKGISGVIEGKDNPAHLAGNVIVGIVGFLMWAIAIVLIVNLIKKKLAERKAANKVELLDADEKADTGDYVVVNEEKKKATMA